MVKVKEVKAMSVVGNERFSDPSGWMDGWYLGSLLKQVWLKT